MGANNVVIGTDGATPVAALYPTYHIWLLPEIFMGAGTPAAGKYVPRVGDSVIDRINKVNYIVTNVDPTTLKPTLELEFSVPINQLSDADKILGTGITGLNEADRLYINKGTMPYTCTIDQRLKAYAPSTNFEVQSIGPDGVTFTVISQMYDVNMNLISNNVPLMPLAENTFAYQSFYTNANLSSNQMVMLIVRNQAGVVTERRQLLVEVTDAVVPTGLTAEYIKDIQLDSPFLSSSERDKILYPLGTPLEGVNFYGIATTSSGRQIRLPVDGKKFQLLSLDAFEGSVLGQECFPILQYNLSDGEFSNVNNQVDSRRFIQRQYRMQTIKTLGAYVVKLYCFPVWVDEATGYILRWFLYTGDRKTCIDATPFVRLNPTSAGFNGKAFGVQQQLQFSVNLKDVSGGLSSYIHSQTVSVTLNGPGTMRQTNWTVMFDPNQNPVYGAGLAVASTMVNQNLFNLSISCGESALDSWLARVYRAVKPLYDPSVENSPIQPTSFIISIGNVDTKFPISKWNAVLPFNGIVPPNGTAIIKFVSDMPDGTSLQLACAGMPIYQQN